MSYKLFCTSQKYYTRQAREERDMLDACWWLLKKLPWICAITWIVIKVVK